MRVLFLLLPLMLSCGPTAPTQQKPPPIDVGWMVLTRDYHTARAYTGITVRIALKKTDYEAHEHEIRVWADGRGRPPILVFKLAQATPTRPKSDIIIVGRCVGPVVDGIARKRDADYCVFVEDCWVTDQSDP